LRNDILFDFNTPASTPLFYETKDEQIARLTQENKLLVEQIAQERILREDAETRAEKLEIRLNELANAKTRKKKTELVEKEYSEFKSDGKRKARPADSIRSYEDFKAIQGYFLQQNKVRDWMMWTIGVALGLRISDLLNLKVKNILNGDKTFRTHIQIIEQKTSKLNNCLITDAVKDAITKYFDTLNWQVDMDDYLFASKKTKGKMYEEYGWKIISDAGKSLNLPINIGSHTMRKSFANIAACVDKSSIDMNSITKLQGLLNHSDQRVTMRYLGSYQAMFDRARVAVSDFILGKTDVHEIVAGNNFTIDDIITKLDSIEQQLKNKTLDA
jgi:integrase